MANNVYKTPLAQAQAISEVPPYSKDALVKFLKNYGSGFTDDAYEEWAKKKGRELKKTPLNKDFIGTDYHKQWYGADRDYTYKDQYINDDEWLEESWPYYADDIYDQASDFFDIDGDYERSYGPVDSYSKYKDYLRTKKEGEDY